MSTTQFSMSSLPEYESTAILEDYTEDLRPTETSMIIPDFPLPSRFTNNTNNNTNNNNTETLGYARVGSVAVPRDDQAIFTSIDIMRDKISYLEDGHADKDSLIREKDMRIREKDLRLEACENEIIHLKSQLQSQQELARPDSALGSEVDAEELYNAEKSALLATVESLRHRQEIMLRDKSLADADHQKARQERQELYMQFGDILARYKAAVSENETLRAEAERTEALLKICPYLPDGAVPTLPEGWVPPSRSAASGRQQAEQSTNRNNVNNAKRATTGIGSDVFGDNFSEPLGGNLSQTSRSNSANQTGHANSSARTIKPERAVDALRRCANNTKHATVSQHATSPERATPGNPKHKKSPISAIPGSGNILYVAKARTPPESPVQTSPRFATRFQGNAAKTESVTNITLPNNRDDWERKTISKEDYTKDLTNLTVIDPRSMEKLRVKLELETRARKDPRRLASAPQAPFYVGRLETQLRDAKSNDRQTSSKPEMSQSKNQENAKLPRRPRVPSVAPPPPNDHIQPNTEVQNSSLKTSLHAHDAGGMTLDGSHLDINKKQPNHPAAAEPAPSTENTGCMSVDQSFAGSYGDNSQDLSAVSLPFAEHTGRLSLFPRLENNLSAGPEQSAPEPGRLNVGNLFDDVCNIPAGDPLAAPLSQTSQEPSGNASLPRTNNFSAALDPLSTRESSGVPMHPNTRNVSEIPLQMRDHSGMIVPPNTRNSSTMSASPNTRLSSKGPSVHNQLPTIPSLSAVPTHEVDDTGRLTSHPSSSYQFSTLLSSDMTHSLSAVPTHGVDDTGRLSSRDLLSQSSLGNSLLPLAVPRFRAFGTGRVTSRILSSSTDGTLPHLAVHRRRAPDTGRSSGPAPSTLQVPTGNQSATENDNSVIRRERSVRIESPNASDFISYEEPNGSSETSMMSTGSRRQRQQNTQELTSAFIIPDITLSNRAAAKPIMPNRPVSTGSSFPSRSRANSAIIEGTILPDDLSLFDDSMLDINEMDTTLRPSQPPAAALAAVMKQLDEEVTISKKKLANYERHYAAHDPSVSRNKRRAIKAKIVKLMEEVERKSDQIYGLQDVVAGQQQEVSFMEKVAPVMAKEEMGSRLASLGIEIEDYGNDDSQFSAASSNDSGLDSFR